MKYNYIAIEGCIGAGKTELAKKFTSTYKAKMLLERFDDNLFLKKFYDNPELNAFPVEIAFLEDRFRQINTLNRDHFFDNKLIFSDYYINKCLVFAKNNLKSDEFVIYKNLFSLLSSLSPNPDLILYIHRNKEDLLKNIQKRGREYEKNIQAEYLANLQNEYMEYLKKCNDIPVLVVEASNKDFINDENNFLLLKNLLSATYDNKNYFITL